MMTMPEIESRYEAIDRMARAKSMRARAMVRDGEQPPTVWQRMFRDVGRCFRVLHSLDLMGGQECDLYERRLEFAAKMAQR